MQIRSGSLVANDIAALDWQSYSSKRPFCAYIPPDWACLLLVFLRSSLTLRRRYFPGYRFSARIGSRLHKWGKPNKDTAGECLLRGDLSRGGFEGGEGLNPRFCQRAFEQPLGGDTRAQPVGRDRRQFVECRAHCLAHAFEPIQHAHGG